MLFFFFILIVCWLFCSPFITNDRDYKVIVIQNFGFETEMALWLQISRQSMTFAVCFNLKKKRELDAVATGNRTKPTRLHLFDNVI